MLCLVPCPVSSIFVHQCQSNHCSVLGSLTVSLGNVPTAASCTTLASMKLPCLTINRASAVAELASVGLSTLVSCMISRHGLLQCCTRGIVWSRRSASRLSIWHLAPCLQSLGIVLQNLPEHNLALTHALFVPIRPDSGEHVNGWDH